jgi:hypothetical protein
MLEYIANHLVEICNIFAFLIMAGLYLFNRTFYMPKDAEICPGCKRWRTQEKLEEKQLGVFRKGHRINRGSAIRMVWYEKYKIQYKCRQCGHKWESIQIRQLNS